MSTRSRYRGQVKNRSVHTSPRRKQRSRNLRFETMETRHLLSGNGLLQGISYIDTNHNNVLDATDPRKFGATINLYYDSNNDNSFTGAELTTPVDTTTTDVNGHYLFNATAPGLYRIVETPTAGYTNQNVEFFTQINSASAIDNKTIEVRLADPTQKYTHLDFYGNGGNQFITLDSTVY